MAASFAVRPSPLEDDREIKAGFPTAHQEKEELLSSSHGYSSLHDGFLDHQRQPDDSSWTNKHHRWRKMSPCHRMLLALAVCLIVTFGVVSAIPSHSWNRLPCPHHRGGAALHRSHHGLAAGAGSAVRAGGDNDDGGRGAGAGNDDEEEEAMFSCLLNAVSSESLHEVLHRFFPNRFKDGVYQSDQSAMEAVRREDPPLATSLIRIAKRQNGTDTTTTTPTTRPTTTDTTTTPTTTTPGQSTTPTTTPTTRQTTPSTSSQTNGTPPTITQGTSTLPSRSQRPVTTTYTSTASNGDLVVVTRTSFVDAAPGPTTGTQADGSLQTNAAVPRSHNLAAAAGAVIGGLILL